MIRIEQIAYYLPEGKLTNEDLHRENPDWNMEKVSAKSGVSLRHIARSDETALDLAKNACDQLFEDNFALKDEIDGVVFCTQSPDYIMPSNAFLLQEYLGLGDGVVAFDFNLACSGFVYGLSIINGLMATDVVNKVLLVTADTYSKYINEKDRSTKVLFSDGAAVTLVTKAEHNQVLDIELSSAGKEHKSFYIPAGGLKQPKNSETSTEKTDQSGNVRSKDNIHMNGFNVWKFIASVVPRQIKRVIADNQLVNEDIDLFLFHQASKLTLNSLIKSLKIREEQVYSNLEYVGNTVSSSLPILIKDALNAGRLKEGDLVLISGFGVGLSWGTILMRF